MEAYVPPDPGPYPQDQPRTNRVRFTPVQVEAIMAGGLAAGSLAVWEGGWAWSCMFLLDHEPFRALLLTVNSKWKVMGSIQSIIDSLSYLCIRALYLRRRAARPDHGGGSARYRQDRHSGTDHARAVPQLPGAAHAADHTLQPGGPLLHAPPNRRAPASVV